MTLIDRLNQVINSPATNEGAWVIYIDGERFKADSKKSIWAKKSAAINALHLTIQTSGDYRTRPKGFSPAKNYKKEFDELIKNGFINIVNLLDR